MLRKGVVVLAAAAALIIVVGASRGSRDRSFTLRVAGRERRYLLHVPRDGRGRMPLVLMFHGGGETPEGTARISEFDAVADREDFIVAYPEGVRKSWNDGRGTTNAARDGVDDVQFVRSVIADIRAKYGVDGRRVYAAGVSNGGVFTNRLGCEMADTFAAIAPVIGPIATNEVPNCHPASPIAVIGIQGEADPLMPFNGGEEGSQSHIGAGGRVESARATQQLWASLNGCPRTATVAELPVANHDGTSVTRRSYDGCRAGTDVEWYEIAGGGHRWPGHQLRLERAVSRVLGVASENIDATETIWAFFKAHPRH